MRILGNPRHTSFAVVCVAVFGAVFFELAVFLGWMTQGAPWPGVSALALYVFQLLIACASIAPLLMAFRATRRRLPLLVALGCASWLLGDVFYVSYAVLLGRALMYPSVADLAFQGFHVAIIVGLWSEIPSRDEWPFWPMLVVGTGLCAIPGIMRIVHPFPLDDLLYATFFMVLVTVTLLIAVGAAYRRKQYALATGLLLVVFADTAFSAASLAGAGFMYALDPVYFVGFAVTSFAVVRAVSDGVME